MLRRSLLLLSLLLLLEAVLKRHNFLTGRNAASSLRCYLFLFALVYCTRHRDLWHMAGQQLRLLPPSGNAHWRQHMFIYQSFLFKQNPKSSTAGATQLVVLFMANNKHWMHDQMLCMQRDPTFGTLRRMSVRKDLVSSLGICALDLYVLTCTQKDDADWMETPSEYNLFLMDRNLIGWRSPTKLQLNPVKPDLKPRSLVLCISRVFAFERWQLLITALEAYRMFQVDLVVAHVQSALESVFKLMQLYESEGLLSIRPGIRFPHTGDMAHDPNAQTEFNGQILLAHECFYEFRQSAQFIGLIDWDDLLIPSGHFRTLPAAFTAASSAYSNVAYFLVNKLESKYSDTSYKSPRQFSLAKLMSTGIMAARMYNDEKLVIRPTKLRGFWMHHSQLLEPYQRPIQLLTNYSIMLHLANEERVESGDFQMPLLHRFDIAEMDRHSRAILGRLGKVRNDLPRNRPYFDAIAECHRLIFAYYRSIPPKSSHCLSYSLCQLPRLESACVAVKSHFRSELSRGGQHGVHVRIGSEFVQRQNGCVEDGGGI